MRDQDFFNHNLHNREERIPIIDPSKIIEKFIDWEDSNETYLKIQIMFIHEQLNKVNSTVIPKIQ